MSIIRESHIIHGDQPVAERFSRRFLILFLILFLIGCCVLGALVGFALIGAEEVIR